MNELNRRLADMSGVVKLFRGRSANEDVEALAVQIAAKEQDENALRTKLDDIRRREPPETLGLDIPTKRSINFMILAFAQQLYLMFDDDELASFVREANEKSPGAVKYGDHSDCEAILARIACRCRTDGTQSRLCAGLAATCPTHWGARVI